MDVGIFQNKLLELQRAAAENGGHLDGTRIREFFSDLELDGEKLLHIMKYLKLQGITVEGLETFAGEEEPIPGKEQTVKASLTSEEKAYLKDYKEMLGMKFDLGEAQRLFSVLNGDSHQEKTRAKEMISRLYMGEAADMAAEFHGGEMLLADLIQEGNLSLVMALEQETDGEKNDFWLRGEIRRGIQNAIEEQSQRNFGDDCLVDKVQKLEMAVKELSEDEDGETAKFSVEELAIILDMEVEEIRDVLKLTGE